MDDQVARMDLEAGATSQIAGYLSRIQRVALVLLREAKIPMEPFEGFSSMTETDRAVAVAQRARQRAPLQDGVVGDAKIIVEAAVNALEVVAETMIALKASREGLVASQTNDALDDLVTLGIHLSFAHYSMNGLMEPALYQSRRALQIRAADRGKPKKELPLSFSGL